MAGDSDAGRATISEAGKLADAIPTFDDSDGEIARARAAYDSLFELARDNNESADIRDRLICGALRLAACHARRNDLDAICDVRSDFETYAILHPGDPGMRRGYCELSVTLCLEYSRHGRKAEADATFAEIQSVAARHPTDRLLRTTLAKAIANRIASHCSEDRTDEALHLHRSLCALAQVPNSRADTMLHRANGTFNLVTHMARHDAPRKAIDLYLNLAQFVDKHPGDEDLKEVLSDAAFALITVFGDDGKLSPATLIYNDLRARGETDAATGRRAAQAAFNLMTDQCRIGDLAEARQLYDDILALSVASPEDQRIALVHAKACANLLLTADAMDDVEQADLLIQELNALVSAWPEDEEIWKVAVEVAPADGH